MTTGTYYARCYCGAVSFDIAAVPETVAYCHCADCRRWTGGPVGAFAAFADAEIDLTQVGAGRSHTNGVTRWNCPDCGSPLMARFDYLPGQSYIPVGIIENANALAPEIHCHAEAALPWLKIEDELPRTKTSGRDALNAAHRP